MLRGTRRLPKRPYKRELIITAIVTRVLRWNATRSLVPAAATDCPSSLRLGVFIASTRFIHLLHGSSSFPSKKKCTRLIVEVEELEWMIVRNVFHDQDHWFFVRTVLHLLRMVLQLLLEEKKRTRATRHSKPSLNRWKFQPSHPSEWSTLTRIHRSRVSPTPTTSVSFLLQRKIQLDRSVGSPSGRIHADQPEVDGTVGRSS